MSTLLFPSTAKDPPGIMDVDLEREVEAAAADVFRMADAGVAGVLEPLPTAAAVGVGFSAIALVFALAEAFARGFAGCFGLATD